MDREERLLAYMQDKLPADARRQFEAEIAADDQLAAEVAALRSARAEFARQDAAADLEAGWASLTEALDAERPVAANTNRPVKLSLAQAAGLVLASVMLWQLAAVPVLDRIRTEGYAPVTEAASGPILQVMFAGSAEMGDISEVLRSFDGSILDGPSAMGVYRISFPSEAQRDAARAALSDRPDLAVSVTIE
ncbi:MAG: hypothetical protein OIF40_16420 [Mangrovicoccus sp.]|nr:hypothetical protein [Mangrovicoccus sp.]